MRILSLRKILDKAQHSRANFDKNIKLLQRTYEELEFDDFFQQYLICLLNLFVTDSKIKNAFVQRSLEFMAKFAIALTKTDEDSIFYTRIIKETIKYHKAENPDVRLHVCEFIKLLLNGIGDTNLDDDLCDEISYAMQQRINDVKPNVRLQAVIASQRLQDPSNKEDPIIISYCIALSNEPNPLIRKAIIDCIAISQKTLEIILNCCLDVSDSVRLAVYNRLTKIPARMLKLEQRQFVLRNGLRSDKRVSEFIKNTLLEKWLFKYDGNYLEFCKALKLDATEEEFKQTIELLETILSSLFTSNPTNELKNVLNLNESKVPQEINFESSVYWRCLVDYLKTNEEFEDCVEEVLPDLTAIIEIIETRHKQISEIKEEWEQLKENQIINQLLHIVLKYEMLDSSERLRTQDFVTNLLTEAILNYDNILLLTKIFEKIESDVEVLSQKICEIVSSIRDPIITTQVCELTKEDLRKRDLRIAPLRVKLNIMREDLNDAIQQQEFQHADQLKTDISLIEKQVEDIRKEYESQTITTKIPKNEVQTVSKCMDVLIAFLNSSKIKEMNAALRSTMDNFVKPNLLSMTDINSDFKALKCFGLMCIIDQKEAFSAIQIFCQQLLLYHYHSTYNQAGLIISANVVIDLLLLYGTRIFGEEQNIDFDNTKNRTGQKKTLYDNTLLNESLPDNPDHTTNATLQDVIEIFVELLDDSNPELREMSGLCLIKLLYHNVIKASGILSKLIIKWYNPATEKDLKLRQMLGIFFSNYALRVPGSLNLIEKAFIPTLNIIINAPQNSPLIDIDIDSLLKFLVDLSRPYQQNCDQGLEVHKNLAVQLCNEITKKPQDNCVPLFIRALLYLDAPYDDPIILDDLKKLASKIFNELNPAHKLLRRQVENYIKKLNSIEFDSTTQNTVNITDNLSNLSVTGGKRKRDSSNHADGLQTINEDNENERDEELLIENIDSEEEETQAAEKEEAEQETPGPKRTLRRSSRIR